MGSVKSKASGERECDFVAVLRDQAPDDDAVGTELDEGTLSHPAVPPAPSLPRLAWPTRKMMDRCGD